MSDIAADAQLALLLEVSGTPKPGNVDREREYPDLRFEHFLAGAVGARDGFEQLASGAPMGEAFEAAIAGMSQQSGGNTQFGAVLLLHPLAAAARDGTVTPETAATVVAESTVEDAAGFYRAFEHVDVAVDDPPADLDAPDVRQGSEAVPVLRERGLTLADVMAASASVDDLAREFVEGFPRTFAVAERLGELDGPVTDRASTAFIEQLSEQPDTFVVTQHDQETAAEVRQDAQAVREGALAAETLAADLIDRGINPGTTADIVAGGLFIALRRGLSV